MSSRTFLLGLSILGLVTGCDSPGITTKGAKTAAAAKAEPTAPVGQATTTAGPIDGANGAGAGGAQTGGLHVSDEITRACGIAAKADGQASSPSFEFDSASLGEDDRSMLADVARCLTDGALRGRSVILVGRADVRGEDEYNMSLGDSRADAVRRYMQDLGVAKDHLSSTSRGEMDAVGTDEEGYRRDRRVDIQLLPEATTATTVRP